MFDGDNFLSFCGFMEKAISLMMKIARFFANFLGILIPSMSYAFFVVLTQHDENEKWKTCDWSSWGPVKQKLFVMWFLTYLGIFLSHLVELFVIATFDDIVEKKTEPIDKLKDLKKIWPMYNLILILPLIGLQVYVSYKVHNLIFRLCSTQ